MPAPVSVIIPALNAEKEIEACLESLVPGLAAGLIREVIVVDGGSDDHTIFLAFKWGARIICAAEKGRGRQLRTGGLNAKGDWLLFLHADTHLDECWPDAVIRHMTENQGHAGAFELRFRSDAKQARWLERRANARAKKAGLPYGDQGLFLSKSFYDALGGFADMPLMEDVEMVRRIGKKRLQHFDCRALTSAAKYERDGWRKRAWSNAFLLTRYFMGANPEKLAKAYK